jgi:hypothetical protein
MERSDFFELEIDLGELFELEANETLKNEDFTRIWTNVVGLPMSRFEYVIKSSEHTTNGYDKDQAVFYGLLVHIYMTLSYMRRTTCKRVIDINTAQFYNRTLLESNTRLLYFLHHPEEIDTFRKKFNQT